MVRIEFLNDVASHLGIPLPMGIFKTYQRAAGGSAQMLGEAQIEHTPKDERTSLAVGSNFDVVANRKRTSFTRLKWNEVAEDFEIEVRNHESFPETVHGYERKWKDMAITKKSQDFVKLDSNTADFVLDLKPNEAKTITYTVTTKW